MEEARYIIFVEEEGAEVGYAAPLEENDREYLMDGMLPLIKPLTDEEYCNSFAYLTGSPFAKSSTVLCGRDVVWCLEWTPGLIAIRFCPDGKMMWGSFRSPSPGFGGRTPTEEDLRYASERDEDEEDNQRNLVFHAWDAIFDKDTREWREFKRADEVTLAGYTAALAHFRDLHERLRLKYPEEGEACKAWLELCRANIKQMAGEGTRIIWQ